ncbi:MAG TPA: cupredoxin family copper-binding protein [Alphaproteobacteria bacterium]|nr:cupredoxin family copper-binding protein [Alphaproteobacteria bacterium]
MTTAIEANGRRAVLRRLLALPLLWAGRRARAQQAAAATVEITGFAFAPAEIRIEPGDIVVFVNRDLVPHTATAGDKSFDTGALRNGERKDIRFPESGTFPYRCRFHPHMTGTVQVA